MSTKEPAKNVVFLHSMWRARSTYVFGRFRANEQFHCYYEPLNESLATDDHLVADQRSRQVRLHHSDLGGGYFDEYDGLWNSDGIGARHFEPNFTYFPFNSANDPSRYLQFLISSSPKPNVLLQPCRSPLRLGYFTKTFPNAQHFFLKRNASEQFRSYQVNEYFIPTHIAYACLQPAARLALESRFPSIRIPEGTVEEKTVEKTSFDAMCSHVKGIIRDMAPALVREVFDVLWELALNDAIESGVTVVDVDDLSALQGALSSFNLSFDDFRQTHSRHEQTTP